MEKLFQDFVQVDVKQWLEKIFADLKDKPKDLLSFKPEFDLEVKSYYHRSEAPVGRFPAQKSNNRWSNRKEYTEGINAMILSDLNHGVDSLGLAFNNQNQFEALTKDVKFEHISSDIRFKELHAAKTFSGHPSVKLNFDTVAAGISTGTWINSLTDFHEFFDSPSENQKLWVSGFVYAEAGASCTQELAFTVNHLNEYVQTLFDKGVGLEKINKSIVIELSVTQDFFVNIAKFKLINHLIALVFKGYDENYVLTPVTIYAKTSRRFLALNDHNNNLLRQTTMAMSAAIGGCDAITVQTLLTGDKDEDLRQERMAKNIPLILKEESYLDKVVDAAEGAYYVDQLCEQMLNKSWALFKEVESEGGLMNAIETNFIQSQIEKNKTALIAAVNSGEKTFLGVNKYPSELEEWKSIPATNMREGKDFIPLEPFRVELAFKKELA